jgi:predicted DNA-binding transcriptional regulator AlpA
MIKSGELRDLLGGIARGTLQKWLELENFPKPIWVGRDRYWRLSDVSAWLRRQPRRKPASPAGAKR